MSGLTSAGFVPKTLDEIRTELETELRTAFGPNIPLAPQSVWGQLVGIFAERESDIYALMEDVYSSAFLGGASGSALDDLGALVGVVRPPATFSEVTLRLTGVNGTPVPAGSIASDPDLEIEWVTTDPVVIGPTGVDAVARPATTGPIVGLSGTITNIVTPVAGWAGVTNSLDAEEGDNLASDAQYRTLIRLTMRAGGGASVEGLQALLLRLDGVTEVAVVENVSEYTDSDGRPPHSFEAVVRGGDDQEIAEQIWFAKPSGVSTFGNQADTVVDTAGDNQPVNWSRPTTVDLWIEIDVEPGDGYPTDALALIEAEVLAYGDEFVLGQDVFATQILQHIETPGIESMTVRVGLSASPTGDRVIVGRTALAVFDSSRVLVQEI